MRQMQDMPIRDSPRAILNQEIETRSATLLERLDPSHICVRLPFQPHVRTQSHVRHCTAPRGRSVRSPAGHELSPGDALLGLGGYDAAHVLRGELVRHLHVPAQVGHDRAHLAAHGTLGEAQVLLLVVVERLAVLVRAAADVAHVPRRR